ncbi:MAG: hypothetical protein OXI59_18650 [Gemmatimonadota bacterium]|nr:hypothetical protein [Gemmatimonadota bacterium]
MKKCLIICAVVLLGIGGCSFGPAFQGDKTMMDAIGDFLIATGVLAILGVLMYILTAD